MDCRILERLGFDSCMAVLEKKQNLASRGGHGHVREKRPNLPCSPSSRSLANHIGSTHNDNIGRICHEIVKSR